MEKLKENHEFPVIGNGIEAGSGYQIFETKN
jgi:hypothetical protein